MKTYPIILLVYFLGISPDFSMAEDSLPSGKRSWGNDLALTVTQHDKPIVVKNWFYLDDEGDRDYCDKFGIDLLSAPLADNSLYIHQHVNFNCPAQFIEAPCRKLDLDTQALSLLDRCVEPMFSGFFAIDHLYDHWYSIGSSAEGVPGLQLAKIDASTGFQEILRFNIHYFGEAVDLASADNRIQIYASCELVVSAPGQIECATTPDDYTEVRFDTNDRPIGYVYEWELSSGLNFLSKTTP